MINSTEDDVKNKRRVVYTPLRGPKERGVLTGLDHINPYKVFVLYDGASESQATDRADLTWER